MGTRKIYAAPPQRLLRRIYDHQRWLNTSDLDHPSGKCLEIPDGVWRGLDFDGVDFSTADLSYAVFRECSFRFSKFLRANLTNAVFEGGTIEGADFSHAILDWAILAVNHDKAKLEGAYWENVSYSMEEGQRKRVLRRHGELIPVPRP